ncbi:PKD domain-containing protein [Hydrogenivirga sp.]
MKNDKITKKLLLAVSPLLLLATTGSSQAQEWMRSYGTSYKDRAFSVQQTSDGGYIVAGHTDHLGTGNDDFWVLKLNEHGIVQWERAYGESSYSEAYSIQQTSDGGYIIAGYGGGDLWVIKVSSDGAVQWQKTYASSVPDIAGSIQETSDGGYIIAGRSGTTATFPDLLVLKLSSNGSVQWQKTYGGNNGEDAYSVQQTSDGGYIVAGYTNSFGAGSRDAWVIKLNPDGSVQWQKTYGGNVGEEAYSIQQTSDGGYIVAGYTDSSGAGSRDAWVIKLNSDGSVQWQKTYGGNGWDGAYSIQQTSDGGYIVAGYTFSFGNGGGLPDFWVFKLDSEGSVQWQKTYGGNSTDEAYSIQQTSDGGYIVAGYTESFGAGSGDIWVLKLNSDGSVSGCPHGVQSSATVEYSNLSTSDTSATVSNANCLPSNLNLTVTETSSSKGTQCYYTEPVINSFSANPSGGSAPFTTTFKWDVSDEDGDTLTCNIDVNNDGVSEYSINDCANYLSQKHTYKDAGNYTAKLTVEDGKGGTADNTVNITVRSSDVTGGGGGGGCSLSKVLTLSPYTVLPILIFLRRRIRR